jgi:hypothetical protein
MLFFKVINYFINCIIESMLPRRRKTVAMAKSLCLRGVLPAMTMRP